MEPQYEENCVQIQMQEKIDQINRLWGIHDRQSDSEDESETRCMALVVDSRYVGTDYFESRIAVSFGDNPFSPEMATGFVPPPVKPGRLLFGLHNVGMSGNKITIFDQWMDSVAAEECQTAEYVLRTAQMILDRVSDEKYLMLCADSREQQRSIERSDVWLLDDLEIAPPEQL